MNKTNCTTAAQHVKTLEPAASERPALSVIHSSADISAVASRCEMTYHSITALHDLCLRSIVNPPAQGDVTDFVILSEALRGIARDMENCAEILENNRGGFGYFAQHYGSV